MQHALSLTDINNACIVQGISDVSYSYWQKTKVFSSFVIWDHLKVLWYMTWYVLIATKQWFLKANKLIESFDVTYNYVCYTKYLFMYEQYKLKWSK